MNRRSAILSLGAISFLSTGSLAASRKPFRVSLIAGNFSEGRHVAGLRVELDKHWKTYWRVPGDAGIPPQFDWTGSRNLASVELLYPLPKRYRDAAGESIGYKDLVVFPLLVAPEQAARPVKLKLDLFFGVCDVVCIPAKFAAAMDLALASAAPASASLIEHWLKRVPRSASPGETEPVIRATAIGDAGKPSLDLELATRAGDIFIESDSTAYFHQPLFSRDGMQARLAIDGLKEPHSLKGKLLRITLAQGARGLEQSIIVN